VVGAGAVTDPLIAVEANRGAIINRLAADFGVAAAEAGVSAEMLRGVLAGLRADQLLAAALVGSFKELTAIVVQPPSDGAMLQRFVALTPVVPESLAALPSAEAYLVRQNDTLTVTKAQDLRLGEASVVGYFLPSSTTTIINAAPPVTRKDGPGSGANSWIGFTAGGNLATGTSSAVAAGANNLASGLNAFVGAGSANQANGTSSLVIGGFDNRADGTDALVGAGAGQRATGVRATIVGGAYNLASGNYAFIGGGGRNGPATTAAGTNALDHVASGRFTVIGGGQGNRALADYATVPGGSFNVASGIGSLAAGNRAQTQTAGGGTIHNGAFAWADQSAFDFNTAIANEFAVRATGGVRFITAIDGTGVATRTTFINTNGTLVAGGNLALGTTTASTGAIYKSSLPFIHTFGTNNTFVGINSGNFTLTGADNSGLGAFALANNTTGFQNTAIGSGAMSANTTGFWNTATGSGALGLNTTGQRNAAHGLNALHFNTTGSNNTANGFNALQTNTTGNSNTATGSDALRLNTTGFNNTVVGAFALSNNTTGNSNTATGGAALQSNTTGLANSAGGAGVLTSNTTGDYGTGFGAGALTFNTIGTGNAAFGVNALAQNVSGGNNTAMGREALRSNTTGNDNIAIGANAFFNGTIGTNNVVIGTGAGGNLTTGSANITIVNPGVAAESNTIRLGDTYHSRAFVAGIRGVTTANNNAVAVVIDSAGQLGTISSSRRFKDDIADMDESSAALMKLRPVTFRYKANRANGAGAVHYGLIAEEVENVYPGMVAHSANGQVETVMYHFLAPMLLNEYQKQQRTIASQSDAIRAQSEAMRLQTVAMRVQANALQEQANRLAEVEQDRAAQVLELAELRRSVEVLLARSSADAKVASVR